MAKATLRSDAIRQPGDRLKGQPQERQHSAAKRDAGPTAPGAGHNIARGIVTEWPRRHAARGEA